MNPLRVLGVDPGAAPTGCLLIAQQGRPWAVQFWEDGDTSVSLEVGGKKRVEPSPMGMREMIREADARVVVVEKVSAFPGEGVTSSFRFGRAAGICEALPSVLDYPAIIVPPVTWKRFLKVPAGKDGSRALAVALAPHLAAHFKRAKDHNRADAFLLAYYGFVQLRQNPEPME